MSATDTHIRWIHEVVDRASAKSRAVAASIRRDVDAQDAALRRSLASQITASTTREQLALRERQAWRDLGTAARRADREIGQAVNSSATAVDKATLRQIEQLRSQGASYRQIAAEARKHGASVSATATAIEASAARERMAYESVARARTRATADTAAARATARNAAVSTGRRGAQIATVGITAGAYAAGRQTIDFDREMRNANALAQLSERAYARVSGSAREVAAETAQMPRTIAEGLGTLIGSGFNASESLLILRSSAKAATAGLTDTGTSTEAVSAVLNAYRLRADQARNVSDTLFRTVDQGVIRFETLAQNIGDVLPFAASLDIGLSEVGASIATMTKSGISGPETMTRIKAVMTTLIKPSEDLAKAIRDQGYESAEAMLRARGFQGTLDDLADSTGGSKVRLAAMFRDVRALGGVLALTGQNSKGANADVRALVASAGAMDRALSRQAQSVSYQWDKLKATASALSIEVGTELVPAMTSALQTGTDFTRDFFGGLTGKSLRGTASDAYEIGRAVRQIGETAGPIVGDFAEIAGEVGKFTAENPELRRLVALLVAAGVAVKAIKFAGAITGVNQLTAGVGRLNRSVRANRTMAGTAGAANLAGGRFAGVRGTGLALAGAGVAVGGSIAGGEIGGVGGSALAGASQGAALGMIAGPWGAAGGALLGAASSALIGAASSKKRKEAEEEARRWARAFTEAVADAAKRGFDPRSARALAEARTRAERSRTGRLTADLGQGRVRIGGRGDAGAWLPIQRPSREAWGRTLEGTGKPVIGPALLAAARSEGRRLAAAFIAGQGRRFTTSRYLLQDFRATYSRLNPIAQQMGATAMVRWARGQERAGRLARGSTQRLIRGLARDFDGLAPRVAGAAARSARALDRLADNDAVIRRTRRLVSRLTGPNGIAALPRATTKSVQGSAATVATYLDRLTEIARDKNAPKALRERAAKELPGLKKAYDDALGQLASKFGGSKRAADEWARQVSSATRRSSDRAEQVGMLRDEVNKLTDKLRSGGSAAEALASKLDGARSSVEGLASAARSMPDMSRLGDVPATPTPRRPRQSRRTGGRVLRFQDGGMVPVWVSSGEEIVEPNGMSWVVPGPRVAADNVFTHLPVGSQVFTEHGQQLKSAGMSASAALATQAPHFARGGVVRTGYTVFDDAPPGAFGGGSKGLNNGYAELGTAVGNTATGVGNFARQVGMRGELPVNFPLTIEINGKSKTLRKRDRGFGQRGNGKGGGGSDSRYTIDIWKDSWQHFGLNASSRGIARVRVGGGGSFSYLRAPPITHSRAVDLLQPYGALDAVNQGYQLGVDRNRRIFSSWRGVDSDLFRTAISGVRPNERDLPKRVTVRGIGSNDLRGATARQRRIVASMVTAANEIAGRPYVYGGHGPGYDCSSAVLYVLNRAGLSSASGSTDQLKVWGKDGSGRYLTVGVRGTSGRGAHTMMMIAGRGFESNSSGVGWRSAWNGSFPIKRTWPGMRRGGVAGRPQIPVAQAVRHRFAVNDRRLDPRDPDFVGWGLRAGGTVRSGRRESAARERAALQVTLSRFDVGVGFIGDAGKRDSAAVIDRMRALAGILDTASGITYGRLDKMRAGIHREIRELMKGGETGRERIQIRRLRGVLTLLESTMGKRIGLLVGSASRVVDAIAQRQQDSSMRLAMRGVDESSEEGLQAAQRSDMGNLSRVSRTFGGRRGLYAQLDRARALRDTDTVRAIREQIATNRQALRETAATIGARSYEIVRARAQRRVDAAQYGVDTSNANLAFLEASQRVDRSSETSAGMLARAQAIRANQPALADLAAAFRAQAEAALRVNDISGWRAAMSAAQQTAADLANSQADAADLIRAAAERQAQDARDRAAYGTSVGQAGLQSLELRQRLAEAQGGPKFDSLAARQERANYIRTTLIPRLQGELTTLQEAMNRARAEEGEDSAAYRQAHLDWMSKQSEIDQASLDELAEIRGNTADTNDNLKQLGGSTTFGFNNQRFTDLIHSGVGV